MSEQKTSDEKAQEIARKARNQAEADIYSLNNPYLTFLEKQEVEMWFQLPLHVMFYTFVITATWSAYIPLQWKEIVVIPLAVNIVVGILNWYFYNKKFVHILYRTILHVWTLYLIGVGAAIFLFFKGLWILAIISLGALFGLLGFAAPHLYLYSILAIKYKMHPKYAFFKKEYGFKFPFEADLE